MRKNRKVVITGAGDVGASFAFALMQTGLAEEIVLLDLNTSLAQGQTLDLAHGLPFVPPVHIAAGTTKDYADAAVIVITAGAKQRPGESRLELLHRNAAIMTEIINEINAQKSEAVIVVVSNPVDILTYVAQQNSNLPKNKIIGSGTVLDSARFRYLLSRHCHVDARNVHAYVLGEHGDSEVLAWSMTHLAGIPMADYCAICQKCNGWQSIKTDIEQAVRLSAYHIIDYKGATYYAIGLALLRIVGAILRDERSVLTVSTSLNGEFGLTDVCLSVPCIVSATGIHQIIDGKLTQEEITALHSSAHVLQNILKSLTENT